MVMIGEHKLRKEEWTISACTHVHNHVCMYGCTYLSLFLTAQYLEVIKILKL